MKEKRYVTLSDYERRVIVLSLNRLRDRVITDGIEERSIRMQENLDRMNDNERRAERQEITYAARRRDGR